MSDTGCVGCKQFGGIRVHSPTEHLAYEARLRDEIERLTKERNLYKELLLDFPVLNLAVGRLVSGQSEWVDKVRKAFDAEGEP